MIDISCNNNYYVGQSQGSLMAIKNAQRWTWMIWPYGGNIIDLHLYIMAEYIQNALSVYNLYKAQ